MRSELHAADRKGLGKAAAVVHEDGGVGDGQGRGDGGLGAGEACVQRVFLDGMAAGQHSGLHAGDRELGVGEADEQEQDEVAGGLQLLDQLDLGCDGSVGAWLPVGEHGLDGEGGPPPPWPGR